MLNSSYGKTIECMHDTETKILCKDEYHLFVLKHFDTIIEIKEVGQKYLVTQLKEVRDQYAHTYIGALVLSVSKRLMNQVMCLAEDEKINIYYQDTDSMQTDYDTLSKLQEAYKTKYHKELIGEQQGQFHKDYESKLGDVKWADQAVYISKKVYCARLVIDSKDTIYDYHVRCKGVSKGALEYETKQRGQTFLDLYIDMHDGARIKFDLCAGKVRFDLKGFDYKTIDHFYRELSF